MSTRRTFLLTTGAAAMLRGAPMTSMERVNRVLRGDAPDRPPISLWHHFGLEQKGPKAHAERTLQFHEQAHTDLVKVMSDFPYPKPDGPWWTPQVHNNPFPSQLVALDMIREGLHGTAPFVETIFNPWNVAEKLSSPAEVKKMMSDNPKRLHAALEAIAKSEANHAKLAVGAGAAGVFLAIANAQYGILQPEEYKRFSEPYDRIVLDAVKDARLNVLHLHGPKVYLDLFWKGWHSAAINYSAAETGFALSQARKEFSGVILGGIDHRNYITRTVAEFKADVGKAKAEAGPKLIVTPGCSVPNDTPPADYPKLYDAVESKK